MPSQPWRLLQGLPADTYSERTCKTTPWTMNWNMKPTSISVEHKHHHQYMHTQRHATCNRFTHSIHLDHHVTTETNRMRSHSNKVRMRHSSLPPVSLFVQYKTQMFLYSVKWCLLAFACTPTIIGGSCHRHNFCCDKTRLLSRQKHACCDKRIFVATKEIFITANIILSWQKFSRDKLTFVATNMCFVVTKVCLSWQHFCGNKDVFVATKVLSRQAYFCGDKHMWCLWQLLPMIGEGGGGGGWGLGESPACVIRGHQSVPLSTRAARTPSTRLFSAENSAARWISPASLSWTTPET